MYLFDILQVWMPIISGASVALVLIRYIKCTLIIMAVTGALTYLVWFPPPLELSLSPPPPPPPAPASVAAPPASPDATAVPD